MTTKLQEALAYERQAIKEMADDRRNIPKEWSIEEQEAFVLGMEYASELMANA